MNPSPAGSSTSRKLTFAHRNWHRYLSMNPSHRCHGYCAMRHLFLGVSTPTPHAHQTQITRVSRKRCSLYETSGFRVSNPRSGAVRPQVQHVPAPAPRVFGTTQLLALLESRGKVEVHDQQVLPAKAVSKLVIDSSSQSVNNGVRSHSTVAMIRSSGEPWGRSFVRWQLNSLGSLQT